LRVINVHATFPESILSYVAILAVLHRSAVVP
jgi:hypothetical protein